jgi:hypothetical protein
LVVLGNGKQVLKKATWLGFNWSLTPIFKLERWMTKYVAWGVKTMGSGASRNTNRPDETVKRAARQQDDSGEEDLEDEIEKKRREIQVNLSRRLRS